MITSGALAAIDLIVRARTQPGDVVVVEDPTFYFVTYVLRMSGVEIAAVPLCEDGIDLNALQALIDQYGERLKVVYAIPSFQNPTGITASDANRAGLAELARRHRFSVIEDSTYQLLYYRDPPPPYLKTYDDSGQVINVGTLSKLVMPALRLGWIWGTTDQVQDFQRFKDDAGNTLVAEMVADFMRSGEFEAQVQRARAIYAAKHDRFVAALDRFAPDWLEWSVPNGGLFLWATLPEPLSAAQLEPFAQERGVKFFAGRSSYVTPPDDRHLRLCFAMLEPDALDEAVARLCAAMRAAL